MLVENEMLPAAICLYTEGVKMVVEGSPVLTELQQLAALGVDVIVCNTCLDYFDLRDKLRVGVVGGMADIVEAQWRAKKVITV
jgi:intracellular sulfur oxidation DsrE/DsrF family protein